MNAKKEIIEHIADRPVVAVSIEFQPSGGRTKETIEGKLEDVLPLLDFEYDEGLGVQELFGTIWYKDGTWSDRKSYDGEEEWCYRKCPEIPKHLTT